MRIMVFVLSLFFVLCFSLPVMAGMYDQFSCSELLEISQRKAISNTSKDFNAGAGREYSLRCGKLQLQSRDQFERDFEAKADKEIEEWKKKHGY